jgi:hypothetical protein
VPFRVIQLKRAKLHKIIDISPTASPSEVQIKIRAAFWDALRGDNCPGSFRFLWPGSARQRRRAVLVPSEEDIEWDVDEIKRYVCVCVAALMLMTDS